MSVQTTTAHRDRVQAQADAALAELRAERAELGHWLLLSAAALATVDADIERVEELQARLSAQSFDAFGGRVRLEHSRDTMTGE